LGGHRGVEARFVDFQISAGQNVRREIDRKSEGVVELEGRSAGQDLRAAAFEFGDVLLEPREPLRECFEEALLFSLDAARDEGAPLAKFWIGGGHLVDHGVADAEQERPLDAQQHAVARGAAQQSSEHVATPFVSGKDPVTDQEDQGPSVVGDDVHRDVVFGVFPPLDFGGLLDAIHDSAKEIGVEIRRHALEDGCEALEARASVDGRLRQRYYVARGVAIELHEDEIPDLEPAPAIAGGVALGALAGAVCTEIDVDLGARPTRAGFAHRPEVLVLIEAEDLLRREPDLLAPEVVRLVVFAKNRDGESGGVDSEVLGEQLPAVLDGLELEIITERKISEHLEEGVMARRAPDVFEIVVLARYAQALLGSRRPHVVAGFQSQEGVLERDHPRVGEQEGRIALGNQRRARDDLVLFRFEKAQERLADFARTPSHHPSNPPGSRMNPDYTRARSPPQTRFWGRQLARASDTREANPMQKETVLPKTTRPTGPRLAELSQ